ncbi:MAG: hypothetical protein DRI39_00080 [Chloroflexi bacterium]|nr:MAG: hypothetical protein DRI39_00080 [Chloroflexota bacterium]
MSDREKLKILLDHWIEHNSEHAEEFMEWAEKAGGLGEDAVRAAIAQAAQQVKKGNEFLLAALEKLKEG